MNNPEDYKVKDFISADTGVTLTLGQTVRTLRELNEMSQEDLAKEQEYLRPQYLQ